MTCSCFGRFTFVAQNMKDLKNSDIIIEPIYSGRGSGKQGKHFEHTRTHYTYTCSLLITLSNQQNHL